MGGTTDKERNILSYLSENVGGDASVAPSPIAWVPGAPHCTHRGDLDICFRHATQIMDRLSKIALNMRSYDSITRIGPYEAPPCEAIVVLERALKSELSGSVGGAGNRHCRPHSPPTSNRAKNCSIMIRTSSLNRWLTPPGCNRG